MWVPGVIYLPSPRKLLRRVANYTLSPRPHSSEEVVASETILSKGKAFDTCPIPNKDSDYGIKAWEKGES